MSVVAQVRPDLNLSWNRIFDRIGRSETRNAGFVAGTGGAIVHDVKVTVKATNGATISVTPPEGFTCTDGVCTATAFGPKPAAFDVQFTAPDREGGDRVALQAEAISSDEDANPFNNKLLFSAQVARLFTVTADVDSGAGSLRQTILDVDRSCSDVPCRVIFALPAPVVIRPESPLPPIRGRVMLDGADNVTLRGDRQPSGDGLFVDLACEVIIEGLSIDGFAGNGVSVGNSTVCLGTTFPPVIINGNTITGNLRGIGGSGADIVWITDNVIGGNRRSAIFLLAGRTALIANNFIGLTPDGAALPNGASGIYVNLFSATIAENVIANNTDFGIAVSATSPATSVRRNRIFGNGHTAIDVGLDLESANGNDAQRNLVNHPVLTDAHYDAVSDRTVVRGHFETKRNAGAPVIELFASAALNAEGHAQAERFIGEQRLATNQSDFEFAAPGNLNGQWIAATATIEDFLSALSDATSELSAPLRVSP